MTMSGKDSRGGRDRHFERRMKAAQAGLHLPTEIELLRDMPFLFDDMASDIREFAERLSRRLKHKPKFEIAPLVATLDDLAVDQSDEALRCVEAAQKLQAASTRCPPSMPHFVSNSTWPRSAIRTRSP